jgi:hypothetical protein
MSTPFDPWAVLGLPRGASAAQARAARRRLAKRFHPDLGSTSGTDMVLVNQAVAAIEATGERAAPEGDSFSVDALPVEAFEALFLVAYGLGEILVADEPYTLEFYLPDPLACFCALSLVPEAGGSIVTIDLGGAEGAEVPAVSEVRDLLVAELRCQQTHSPGPG